MKSDLGLLRAGVMHSLLMRSRPPRMLLRHQLVVAQLLGGAWNRLGNKPATAAAHADNNLLIYC